LNETNLFIALVNESSLSTFPAPQVSQLTLELKYMTVELSILILLKGLSYSHFDYSTKRDNIFLSEKRKLQICLHV